MKSKALQNNQAGAIEHLLKWKVGALFMEAGTGKTRVALELLNASDADFCLYICPLRTIDNTREEIARWGGTRIKLQFLGVESLSASDRIFLRAGEDLRKYDRPFIIVDESLKIKNLSAKRTQRVISLGHHAEYKLILNGTPLSRNLLDLYPQMLFLSPKILGGMTETRFKDTFCNYTQIIKRTASRTQIREIITGYSNIDYLYSLIRNYIYRCDLQLSISQDWEVISYQIDEKTKQEYHDIKQSFLSVEGLEKFNDNIFIAMTQKMQHSYCDCEAKMKAVEELFKSGKAEERKTLIFCKFVNSATECESRFPSAKVLTYGKNAYGLNLQKYRYTIYFDKTFDWAQRLQSSRRTFRTGQEYDCKYFDLTGDVGLETMIDRNIDAKTTLSDYFKKQGKEQIIKEL